MNKIRPTCHAIICRASSDIFHSKLQTNLKPFVSTPRGDWANCYELFSVSF